MISKKILLYGMSGALSLGSTIPFVVKLDNNNFRIDKLNKEEEVQKSYFAKDYVYKHKFEISENTLEGFNKAIFDYEKYIEIEKNINDDFKPFNTVDIDIIKNQTVEKIIDNRKVYCAMFQIKPKEGYYWSDYTNTAKNLLIPFENVEVNHNANINVWNAFVPSYLKFKKAMMLKTFDNDNLKKFIAENEKAFLNYENLINSDVIKFANLKIQNDSFKLINKNTATIKILALPEKNHFWNDGTNFEKEIIVYINIKSINESFAKAPLIDTYKNKLEINVLNLEYLKQYFKDKTNVDSFIKNLFNENKYQNVNLVFKNIFKYENDKYSTLMKVEANNDSYFPDGTKYKNIWVKLDNLSGKESISNVKYCDSYVLQLWWSKEFFYSDDIKEKIFDDQSYEMIKNVFEKKHKNLKIDNFIKDSAFFGRFAKKFDSSYKAYVDAMILPNDNYSWKDKTNNLKKTRIYIEGWYINNQNPFNLI